MPYQKDPFMLAVPTLAALPQSRKRLIFSLLLMTNFVGMLDVHSVSTALTYILQDLGGNESLGWLTAAYMIAQCSVMPIYGKLGDLFGRKPALLLASLIFIAGALACAAAPNFSSLIAARVLQGAGSGGIIVSVFATTGEMFAPRERARYQSFSSLVLVLASAMGPISGGLIAEALGWRSVFLLGMPCSLIALVLLWRLMPSTPHNITGKIDVAGALTLTFVISAVVLVADSANLFPASPVLGAIGLAALGLGTLLLWIRIERRASHPILPLSLFAIRGFAQFLLLGAVNGALALGLVTSHILYLQLSTGLPPAQVGLFLFAVTIGLSLGSLCAGQVIARTGQLRGVQIASMLANFCALMLLALLPFGGLSYSALTLLMMLQGLSVGFAQQVPILGIQSIAPRAHLGAATSTVTLARTAGAAISVAVYAAILVQGLKDTANGDIAQIKAALRLDDVIAQQSASDAFAALYSAAAALALIGLILALRLPKQKP